MNGHDYPELFDADDSDQLSSDQLREQRDEEWRTMISDPEWLVYDAECEAREDFDRGVSLADGVRKLRDRGDSEAEIRAYINTYQLNSMARDAGLTIYLPMRPF